MSDHDPRVDSYRAWLWWLAVQRQAAKGEPAEENFRAWCATHGVPLPSPEERPVEESVTEAHGAVSSVEGLIADREYHVNCITEIDTQLAKISERVRAAIIPPASPRKLRSDAGEPRKKKPAAVAPADAPVNE